MHDGIRNKQSLHSYLIINDTVFLPHVFQVVTRELGIDGLKEVCSTPGLFIPVVAIGGIAGADRIKACLQDGGANGIAVVSAIFGERDVESATSALLTLVKSARPVMEEEIVREATNSIS